jgi:hypothetical protein
VLGRSFRTVLRDVHLQGVALQFLIHHFTRQPHVAARRRERLMPERLAHDIELRALADVMGGEGVAQGMG